MKKMKEIRGKSEAELKEAVEGLRRERFNLRSQAVTGSLESPARVRNVRRELARVLTALAEHARKSAPAKPKTGGRS